MTRARRAPGEGRLADAVDAVVLAAGRGVRLGRATARTPKVLLEVAGRPLLDYHLEALASVGVRRVVLVVQYLAEQIEQHVRDRPVEGLDITFVRQREPLGTGHAVLVAGPNVRTDRFLVCYADVFLPSERRLLRDFLSDPIPKIAAAEVEDGGSFGRLSVRAESGYARLVGLEEKDGRPVPALVNAGLYLLPKSILDRVARLSPSVRGEYELTDAIREYVTSGGEMRVVPVGEWVDAGTKESLARARDLGSRARP